MSRYQGSYDAGESRRSPRDQSPGRYNDSRDEFRGGGARGGERRRSIPDARINHNSFASNRELFREPTGRDSSRDFNSSRDPPRGPKGFPDAPTGPRASSHSEFRGDFGGYRGDFRGERGRGRGRGWRDDSRDRGRELDREYRDRRDDRGPPPQFRDDRGRERWGGGRESYRGRRASSPQGRGRSPNYGPRDSRDPPPNIEIDRARRGSRDGPLSGGSPGSDSMPPFARGYGRAPRGGRGRGRGGFYEDGFHRPSGRSRSPEPSYRRTQPSATPPPQVPAFGSTAAAPMSSNLPSSSVSSTTDTAGPLPGVAIPTAPRSDREIKISRSFARSVQHKPSNTVQKEVPTSESQPGSSVDAIPHSVVQSMNNRPSQDDNQKGFTEPKSHDTVDDFTTAPPKPAPVVVSQENEEIPTVVRQGLVGKHGPEAPVPPASDAAEVASESESEDEVNDAYFEDEISKIEADTTRVNVENPQNPRPESPTAFMRPFRRQTIDRIVEARKAIPLESCVAPEVKVEETAPEAPVPPVPVSIPPPQLPVPVSDPAPTPTPGSVTIPDLPAKPTRTSRSRSSTPAVPFKPKAPARSRPSTPSLQPKEKPTTDIITNGGFTPAPAPLPSARTPLPSVERAESIPSEPTAPLRSIEQSSHSLQEVLARKPTPKPTTNGLAHKSVAMDVFSESEGDMTEAENEEMLEAVRPRMKTPPISSLPNFGVKKWFEDDDFLETLKPKPEVEVRIKQKLIDDRDRKLREQKVARDEWGKKYYEYRRFTDFSDDPIAVRSREKFAKARALAAAEAAAPHQSSVPSAGAKPEGKVRMGRWATEHDFERVLRESELEAKETQEKEDRAARAKTASAKEASIPDAAWDREEWMSMQHIDRTHLVPFERSFAILEFGEPIDNFTEEEAEIFERVYLEFPKQWSKIAAALTRRDYKACIQHYYLIKHISDLKDKLKRQPKKRKARQPKAKNPKPNALIADVVPNREEADDTQDTEGGERRGRPRRAAAPTFSFETPASESEVASPAPTPGRKATATPKGDTGTDAPPPPPKRKTKATREKGAKQAKNSQLLAAAPPIAAATPRADSPATPMAGTEWKNRRDTPGGNARFPSQFDGPGPSQPSFQPPYAPIERPNPSMPINFDPMPQHFPQPAPPLPPPQPERLESAPPMSFETQQDRRTIPQQTSSYWSVPEQTDFPALLRHFGTDWHGIAKWMTSKTHIMVYTTVFQQWLAVPSDSNKSRRVANIQTQVKNYYQRQVDSGKKEWEIIAKDADEKRERNEPTGPLPTPTVIPKRRYDVTPGSHPRSSSAMDQTEEFLPPGPNSVMSQVSPPQPPSLSARFPALAQAGPVPQIQPVTATSTVLNKHMPPQPIQQAPQQIQQQTRPTRGPAIGFFSTEAPSRPIVPNDAVSQRSVMVAQEAQIERQSALRLEREQREQQQQREQLQREQEQAIQREQEHKRMLQQRELAMQQQQQQQREQQALHRNHQFQMKQENETPNPNQYEPYSTPAVMLPGNQPHARSEPPKPIPPPEVRRTAPPQHHAQQYQPRSNPNVRPFIGESVGSARDLKSTPSPAVPRAPMSAPPANQEMYSAPPPPPPPQQIAPPQQSAPVVVRQPEPARKSNIMSLLNDDEPSDPRPPPPKRASDVPTSSIQNTRTPPPQHPLHPSRYSTHPAQNPPQQHPHMPQQMTSQPPPQQQAVAPQHGYSQPPQAQHALHQHSSSIGHTRSFTPTGFDNRPPYGQPQMQQQQQQQMYSQPRQSMTSQPSQLRREPSIGEMHGMTPSGGYARSSAPSQPSMRLKESPYSAPTPPPQAPQAVRQSMGSPHDAPLDQRDYYQRQPQPGYFIQPQQQQQNATASPQLGPSYNSPSQQHQQPLATHRQLAFGQNSPHVPSPPAQYAQHHSLHNSRHNSFDGREGRYQMGSSAPTPAPAPAHAGLYRQYSGAPEGRTQRNDGDRNAHAMMDLRRETEVRREAERRELERRELERRDAERRDSERQRY